MKKIITLLATVAVSLSAFAQLDSFYVPRTLVVTAPTQLAGALTTNLIDKIGYSGIGKLDICVSTNSTFATAAGTLTVKVEGSNDTNTWTAVSYAQATSTSQSYTNLSINTNAIVSDTFLLPGTITTPTAYTAGFATPYLAPNALSILTNTAAITVTSGTPISIGLNLTDNPRYLHVIYTATGGFTTNANVSAILTGFKGQ